MKSKMLLLALAAVVLLGSAPAAFAQADDGEPDSLIWVASRPATGANDSLFQMELYYWGDADTIVGMVFGWRWDNPNVTLDSAKVSPEVNAAIDALKQVYFSNSLSATNDSMLIVLNLLRFFGPGLVAQGSRIPLATYWFSLSSWSGSDVVNFDTSLGGSVTGVDQFANDWNAGEIRPVQAPVFTIQDPSDAGDLFDPTVPKDFELSQNYPNPFNPTTTIRFALPVRSNVELNVYNLLGQRVRTLRNEEMDAGSYSVEWNGANDGGAKVASGVYFYKLETSDFVDTKKMLLVK